MPAITTASAQELVDRALAASTADDCIAIASHTTDANLRWANNTLTTNGEMRRVDVAVVSFVRKAGGPATASRSGSATTVEQVAALVEAADAAAREAEEETGWRAHRPIRPLIYTQPSPGIMTSQHHIFRADGADHIGEPEDAFESDRIEWIPLDDIRSLIDKQHIVAGTTLAALLLLLADR